MLQTGEHIVYKSFQVLPMLTKQCVLSRIDADTKVVFDIESLAHKGEQARVDEAVKEDLIQCYGLPVCMRRTSLRK